MIDLAIISGSGFYDFPGLEEPEEKTIKTSFGRAPVWVGHVSHRQIAFIARHGLRHTHLPNMINFRASLMFHRLGLLTLAYVFLQFLFRLIAIVVLPLRERAFGSGKILNRGIIVLAVLYVLNWGYTLFL